MPRGIELGEVANLIGSTAGIAGVHDLHAWALTSGVPSLSAHLVLQPGADADAVRLSVTEALADRFAIRHVTLQTVRIDFRTKSTPAIVH